MLHLAEKEDHLSQILAVLWDYDGTIVDSARKNMKVTVEILRHFDPDIEAHLPSVLQSYEAYQEANHYYSNWRDLYTDCYGIPSNKLDEAGRLWTPEQQKSEIIPDMFSGLDNVIRELKGIPMGICSQNGANVIWESLKHYGIADFFSYVVGYAEVPGEMQKPHPFGFIKCAEVLNPENKEGTYLYIGDHSDDVIFGRNGETETGHRVICITVDFLGLNRDQYLSWKAVPEYYTESTQELMQVIKSLI